MTQESDNKRFVEVVQEKLGIKVDGWAGPATVAAWIEQHGNGVKVVTDRFSKVLAETLKHEGGWADHPKDPGGATMKGVTLAVYQAFKPGATKQDLRNITDADLKAIYRKGYWDKVRGDDLPAGVDMVVFDIAVNSGPRRAAEWLQEAVGATVDGIIGDQTVVLTQRADAASVIDALDKRRDRFYRSLSTWTTFGKGWTSRRLAVTKKAREMAA